MAVYLSNKRYEQIKQIVADTFEYFSITCVPISGFEIAKKMGISVIPYSALSNVKRKYVLSLSDDGFTFFTKSKTIIYYNDSKNYDRINFTLMHEIGHIVLEHSEDSELADKEANFFAKFALAPPVLIHRLQIKEPIQIAQIFEISYEMACNALSYYNKWLKVGSLCNTNYENKLIRLFKDVS